MSDEVSIDQFHTVPALKGLTPAEDLWECYVIDPSSNPDPSAWRTELNRPLLG